MNAFEKIKNSIEMTALVRAAVYNNPDYVSLRNLEKGEYERFRIMHTANPYSTTRAVNRALRAIGNEAVRKRHVNAAVELECLVEREWLEKSLGKDAEGPVMRGIDKYLWDGYTEMALEPKNKGRKFQEKFRVDKSSINNFLREAREIAVNCADEEEAIKQEAGFVADMVDYNKKIAERIWKKHGDKSIMISRYLIDNLGVCRHMAVLTQLALQEAGIETELVTGVRMKGKKKKGAHMWNKAWTGDGTALIDTDARNRKNQPFVAFSSSEFAYQEYAQRNGNEIIVLHPSMHFYKYSARGPQ